MFVGTGDGAHDSDSLTGVGLYRITDAETDTPTVSGPFNLDASGKDVLTGRAISKVLVNPDDPNMVFVSTTSATAGIGGAYVSAGPDRGVYRCDNAFDANPVFTKLNVVPGSPDTRITDMALEPGNPAHLLVAVQGFNTYGNGGLYRSLDATDPAPTFSKQLALDDGVNTRLAIVNVGGTVTAYAATTEQGGRLRKSTDGGASWTTFLPAADGFAGTGNPSDIALAVDPSDAGVIYLGGPNHSGQTGGIGLLKKSTDGGATFADADGQLRPHTHVVTLAPSDSSVIYTGNDGGVWRSDNAAADWTSLNSSSLNIASFQSVALSPTDPNVLIAGAGTGGTLLRQADGSWVQSDGGYGGDTLITADGTTFYHTYFNQSNQLIALAKSPATPTGPASWTAYGAGSLTGENGPGSGTAVSDGLNLANATNGNSPLAYGPGPKPSLYFGTDRLYQSVDGGKTMKVVSQGPLAKDALGRAIPVSSIAIAATNDKIRLVGLGQDSVGNVGRVFATVTGSAVLKDITKNLPPARVNQVVIDPANPNVAYVVLGGSGLTPGRYVWRTTNLKDLTAAAPKTDSLWQPVGAGLPDGPVNAFLVDPADSNSLFAGTETGVFHSADGGLTWAAYGTGMPQTEVTDLAFQSASRLLAVATRGRGLFETTVPAPAAPQITTANSALFPAGQAGTFDVTVTGPAPVTLTITGKLPAGVTFHDNGQGHGQFTGKPAASAAKDYPLTITAHTPQGNLTQSFLLTVTQPLKIVTAATTTFSAGKTGSFLIRTSGFPVAALSVQGTLPAGMTFTDNGKGMATLSGKPAAGTAGSYAVTITATNRLHETVSQSFTFTVTEKVSISSPAAARFATGAAGRFTITTKGYPAVTLSLTNTLPAGMTFTDNGDGTATIAGTPSFGGPASFDAKVTAKNSGGSVTQVIHATVDPPLLVTGPLSGRFGIGSANSVTIGTLGGANSILSETGALPAGVTFVDHHDGTAAITGTPAAGTAGTYPLTITADKGNGLTATGQFTVIVGSPPVFTSVDHATFTVGQSGSVQIAATGTPAPLLSMGFADMPAGVSFDPATGLLSGTPGVGTGARSYQINFYAINDVGADILQTFTLFIHQPLQFTSVDHATFIAENDGFIGFSAIADTSATISLVSGILPAGVTFTEEGGYINGIPEPGTEGDYPITLNAHTDADGDISQSFVLHVKTIGFTTADQGDFQTGQDGLFLLTAQGPPSASIVLSVDPSGDALPAGVTLTDNGGGSGYLSGTPDDGTGGVYHVVLRATSDAFTGMQTVTLVVGQLPSFTSLDHATFASNTGNTFQITTTGFPDAELTLANGDPLPAGLTFTDNGNGTATLAGTPAAGTAGAYHLSLRAKNRTFFYGERNAYQDFTLTIS